MSGEKTEKPTAKRLKKARSEGTIARTPELGAWLSLLASTFVIPKVCSNLMSASETTMVRIGGLIQNPDIASAMQIARSAMLGGAKALLPLPLLVLFTSICLSAAQGGIYLAPKLLVPKLSKLSPFKGLKRMFGTHGLWELGKSLGKIAILGTVVYFSMRSLIPTLSGAGSMPLNGLLDTTVGAALRIVRFGSAAGVLLAAVDFAVVKRRTNKQLKMSKQEIKDEHKSAEGDPHIKGQIRQRQIAMARNRMMADVPTADVVMVNPTHVAVALKYDADKGAPRVIAKGSDHLATQIRAIAEENHIPMVSDIPLARTLYKMCEVGQEIPTDLYQAVATVLAFIMRLKRIGSADGIHQMPQIPGVKPLETPSIDELDRPKRRRPARPVRRLDDGPAAASGGSGAVRSGSVGSGPVGSGALGLGAVGSGAVGSRSAPAGRGDLL